MITRNPRSAAFRAKSAVASGVRCAERTLCSLGTPSSSSSSTEWRIVSQSDLLPMITATSAEDFDLGIEITVGEAVSFPYKVVKRFLNSLSFQERASNAYWRVNLARSIVLIGMMGAGKSSVGRCLQRRTRLARFDTDEIVSSKFGLSISEIFSMHGERRFREVEAKALVELAPKAFGAIIVTGGGIVLRQENVEDRKSTRLNSSHITISYAVFCLKKENQYNKTIS